jgi:hypothetical protein
MARAAKKAVVVGGGPSGKIASMLCCSLIGTRNSAFVSHFLLRPLGCQAAEGQRASRHLSSSSKDCGAQLVHM